jgi:hypothetical protein
MSEKTKRGTECSEHSVPPKTSESPGAETESFNHYGTKLENPKEGKNVVAGEDVYSYVLQAANALFAPSQVVELRALFKNGRVDSGYFDDFELLVEAAVKLDERADVSGVYWTLNPVNPDCLWNIAGFDFVYGDPYQWKRLYDANRDTFPDPNNPDWIEPGQILKIPPIGNERREGTR